MTTLNKVIIIGRLGRDPEFRYTRNGAPVCNFTLATDSGWGEKKVTEWINCVAFGREGKRGIVEVIAENTQKGSLIYVEGRLQTRSWEQEGVKRYMTEVVIGEVKLLPSARSENSNQSEVTPVDPDD